MLDGLGKVSGFLGFKKYYIDFPVSRLHYRVTVALLVAFSIIIGAKQYVGDPINCINHDIVPQDKKDDDDNKVHFQSAIDTFCWIHATFSVPDAWKEDVGDGVVYPGVRRRLSKSETGVHHAYYQWVCFVLFLQALAFYLPHYFWKTMEKEKVKSLVAGFDGLLSQDPDKAKLVAQYFNDSKGQHFTYYICYLLSEIFFFANTIVQIYVTDAFLNGEFLKYGSNVFNFSDWRWQTAFNPMVKVFPRMTKCQMLIFGTSGDIQKHDVLCLLPINIFNEKIYLFLWVWFILLAVVSGLYLLYCIIHFIFPDLFNNICLSFKLHGQSKELKVIIENFDRSDLFLLDLIRRNLRGKDYENVIKEIANSCDEYSKLIR